MAEFAALQWTFLQSIVFTHFYLSNAAGLIRNYRKTGKQDTLRLMASEDSPMGIVNPKEVGVFAAHLLSLLRTKKPKRHPNVVIISHCSNVMYFLLPLAVIMSLP